MGLFCVVHLICWFGLCGLSDVGFLCVVYLMWVFVCVVYLICWFVLCGLYDSGGSDAVSEVLLAKVRRLEEENDQVSRR